jgi:hypothetical protein
VTKACAYCGEPFEVDELDHNEIRRMYCSDFCRSEAQREKARERVRVGKRAYNVECEICGKIFLTNRSTNKTCGPDCYYIRQKKVKKEQYYRSKEAKKNNELPKQKKKQKRIESLTEVQRKAREAGMTYGKYMEMLFIQQLQEERERNGK